MLLPFAFSQDMITTKSGDEISCRVLEITPMEIKFTTADKTDVIQILPKINVFMIKYENGKKDVFKLEPEEITQAPAPDQNQMFAPDLQTPNSFGQTNYADVRSLSLQGQYDAIRYYRDYKNAGTATLVSTILSPTVGLVTAIATSVTAPASNNLGYPDKNLFAQPAYASAYKDQAKKTKAGKVWRNFGFGLTPWVAIAFTILFVGLHQ